MLLVSEQLSPGVREVQLLLDQWGLSALKETFAREEVSTRTLECLEEDDKDLNEIIPKFGQRKIFWCCLKKWNKSKKLNTTDNGLINQSLASVAPKSTSTPIVTAASPATTVMKAVPINLQDSQPSTSGIIEATEKKRHEISKPEVKSGSATAFLNKLLNHDRERALKIKTHFMNFRKLDDKHRNILIDLIMTPLFKQMKTNQDRCKIWKILAEQIEKKFTGEQKENHYRRLKIKYYNMKRMEGQCSSKASITPKSEDPTLSPPQQKIDAGFSIPSHIKTIINGINWDINLLLEKNQQTSEMIENHFNTNKTLDKKHRDMLANLLLQAIFDRNMEPGFDIHQIFMCFAKQIEHRFPGEQKETYYISSTLPTIFLNLYYDRKQVEPTSFINQGLDNTQGSKLEAVVPDISTNNSNASSMPTKIFDENVTLLELLELYPDEYRDIEDSFCANGQIDKKHQSTLVSVLINSLYDSIRNSSKRQIILKSLALQITQYFPEEKFEDYEEKLRNRFYNMRRDRIAQMKKLPLN